MTTTKKSAAPQPQPMPEPIVPVDPLGNLRDSNSIEARLARLATIKASEADRLSVKAELRSNAIQRLHEANMTFADADSKSIDAKDAATKGAAFLYQGATSGLFSNDEVSAILGDEFGYVPKKDGTPGKTPAGQGGTIRKRIIRARDAFDYATGTQTGGYCKGIPREEVQPVIAELSNRTITVWTAYDKLAELKAAHAVKTEAAFNPARIASIVEALSLPEAVPAFAGNGQLQAAYQALTLIVERLQLEVLAIDAMQEAPAQ